MKTKLHVSVPLSFAIALAIPFFAQAQTVTATCTAATLTGTRSLILNGRDVSAGVALSQTFQAVGSASFDGANLVTFTLAVNTNKSQGQTQTLSGGYSLATNCVGRISITSGDTATYTLIVYNSGRNFTITGQDGVYALAGSGGTPPATCIASSLSGAYAFSGNGFTLSSSGAVTGVNNISGILQFDGRNGVTGSWSVPSSGTSASDTASGEYALTSSCQGSATIKDARGTSFSLTLSFTSTDNANFGVDIATSQTVFAATGHATFNSPSLTIENGASYVSGGTPAGSDFVLFGTNLSNSAAGAPSVPLPRTLLATSVTVNGEAAPLYFVNQSQINAQMPLDIQPGLATVTVTTAGKMSNSAAVNVPAGAAPGIFFYSTDRGVVQNPNFSLNSPTAPAHVGDVLVGYFTGGGPVSPAGPLTTGAGSPVGLSPVTAKSSVTVGGQAAVVNYIGLAPTLVGVYQVDFVVPQVAAGDRSVVINIGGTNSLAELITIGN